jgi:hypothetical protein
MDRPALTATAVKVSTGPPQPSNQLARQKHVPGGSISPPHAEVEKFIHDPAGWSKAHGGAAEAAE